MPEAFTSQIDDRDTRQLPHPPRIGIVILNFNKADDTIRCVQSIQANDYSNYEMILVDNGSTDGSIDTIRRVFPELYILECHQNLGYTGGNNRGIQHFLSQPDPAKARFDYLLLLNEDSRIADNALSELASAVIKEPGAGFLGPKLLTSEYPQVILSAGGYLQAGYLPQNRGIGETDQGQYDEFTWVDFVSGCAILVKRQAIEDIGMLDEDYFIYNEEVDWCYRGKRTGFPSLYVPTARAWHPDTRLRDIGSANVTYYSTRNLLLFAQRNKLGMQIKVSIWLMLLRRWLSWSLRPRWRSKAVERDALRAGLWDYTRKRFGKWQPN